MFDCIHRDVAIVAMIDTRRAKKSGLFPLKIRVTHKREQRYYSPTPAIDIATEDWALLPKYKAANLTRQKLKELKELSQSVKAAFDEIEEVIKALVKDDAFTFEVLNNRLSKGKIRTVNDFFKAKIDELKALGKVSTADWYKYTLRSIRLFKRSKNIDIDLEKIVIEFKHITVDWLRRYEQYLLDEGKSYTTISMYMRALQVVVNEAKAADIIKPAQHPFGKGRYEIPQHVGRNIALTLSEIKKIVQYECETDTVEKCRDLWFFSYLCNGANITDICKLRYTNIRNGEVCFYRQKTLAKAKKKKLIHATLLPEMQAVISRWGNEEVDLDTFVFPILQGEESPEEERTKIKNITKLMNTKLKAIGKKLGIPNISTYTARHSYATVLKRSGANIAFISESLGHNDLKTTENYLASFEQEERVKNAALLTNF